MQFSIFRRKDDAAMQLDIQGVQKHETKLHALKQKKHQNFLNRPSAEASRPGHISVARQLLSAGAGPDQGNRSALRVVHTLSCASDII